MRDDMDPEDELLSLPAWAVWALIAVCLGGFWGGLALLWRVLS